MTEFAATTRKGIIARPLFISSVMLDIWQPRSQSLLNAMNPTLADFRTTFPEFEIVPDNIIEQRLSWAIAQCDENTWGDLREQGVLLLAAHLVVLTPGGNPLRIEPPKGEKGAPRSLYEAQYRTLLSLVGITRRIASIEQELSNLRRWR